MDIFWLGHSSFRLKGKETTVITDPCPPDFGYAPGKLQADIVVISHGHKGHSYAEGVSFTGRLINRPGEYEVRDVNAVGWPTFHDGNGGRDRGKNTVFIFRLDGLTVAHLGDIGHVPDSQLMGELGKVDILFVPAGDVSTISASQAAEIMRRAAPGIVIPMHYKTPALKGNLEPIDKFLKEAGSTAKEPQPKLTVSKATVPASTQVVVLAYPSGPQGSEGGA